MNCKSAKTDREKHQAQRRGELIFTCIAKEAQRTDLMGFVARPA